MSITIIRDIGFSGRTNYMGTNVDIWTGDAIN